MRELEDILGVAEESLAGEQCTEFPDLVEEQVGVPVLAVELVAFDIREHAVRERDHLVVGAAFLLGGQQFAVIRDQLAALGLQFLHRSFERLTRLDEADVAGNAREWHRQVVVPGAVVMVEAVADIDVEPGIARGGQLL